MIQFLLNLLLILVFRSRIAQSSLAFMDVPGRCLLRLCGSRSSFFREAGTPRLVRPPERMPVRAQSTTTVSQQQQEHPQRKNQNLSAVELRIPTAQDMEDMGGLLFSTFVASTGEDASSSSSSSSSSRTGLILLDGDLGAGKTALSRGFIRAATGEPDLRVTSPTYLLSNTYRYDQARYE